MEEESKRSLGLLDATMIVAGSMIGSGIFIVSADISRQIGGGGWLMLSWIVAGLMTLFAALSYGELAGMFPHAGGQYVYLRKAYKPIVGFLYGWALFIVVQSGTIAAVAVAFAKFTGVLIPSLGDNNVFFTTTLPLIGEYKLTAAQLFGIFSLFVLTLLNSLGIQYGKFILRLFTSAKLIALFGIIILGIFVYADSATWQINLDHFWDLQHWEKDKVSGAWMITQIGGMALLGAFGAGLVGSLFSSDAWNNVTFIAGEIKNPKKNIPISLFAGTLIVSSIYVLANVAFLRVLPLQGSHDGINSITSSIQFATNDRVGTAAATMMFGATGTLLMAVLIMISTFGCNNGLILASVRLYQAMAKDGLFFSKMQNNNKYGVPGYALWIQFVWASILALSGQYGTLLDYVMFAVILFYIFTIIGIFILRKKMPEAERPYKAFGYPIVPAIYILLAVFFCLNLLITKPIVSWTGIALVAAGIPVYYFFHKDKGGEELS
ncbi:MAG: amino acid permease [Bacteroidia bacterium]